MKRGAVCLLVLGLANILNAAELGLEGVTPSELKEIEKEIAKGNVPPNYTPSDKLKRGVAKLTNADSPTFNHLTNPTSSKQVAASTPSSSPYRYVYSNQYTNPYLSYLQAPQHAAQIAAQYAFPSAGVTHYLQTPTQIQYVSTPSSLGSIPSARYQALTGKIPMTTVSAAGSVAVNAGAAATPSQYVTAPQQLLLTSPQTFIPQAYVSPSAAASASSSSASASSPNPSASATTMAGYPTQQQLYYPQQPIVMLLVNPQPHPMYLYPNHHHHHQQQQQMAYLLGQHPLLNLFGAHRFALPYSPAHNGQVTYLVPMQVSASAAAQAQAAAAAAAASSAAATSAASNAAEQAATVTQDSSSSNTFGLRTTKS